MKSGKRVLTFGMRLLGVAIGGTALLWVAVVALRPSTTVILPNGFRGWAIILLDRSAEQPDGILTRRTYVIPPSGVLLASSLRWLDLAAGFPIECAYRDGTPIPKWRGGDGNELTWSFLDSTIGAHPFVVVTVVPSAEQKVMKLTPTQFEEIKKHGIPDGFVVPRNVP